MQRLLSEFAELRKVTYLRHVIRPLGTTVITGRFIVKCYVGDFH